MTAALFVGVLVQAIHDLSDPDPNIHRDANAFFFSTSSGWTEMRKFYCNAVGVDPRTVQEQLRRAGKVEPQPVKKRGVNPFTVEDMRALIPTESAFQLADLTVPKTVPLQVKQARLAALIKEGFVEKVGITHYALTSLHHPRMLTNKERVLSVLEHRPMQTKEIAACLWPRLPASTVFADCERLVEEGLADKCGPGIYRLRRVERIAA